ncbi:hypothetical protein SEA_UZUMAKI_72 [Arthrobacter phage Uzumaki]|nr:hypothetical protein SEA_UZUMAKI_72 [Arthrobacter phage Uzumaki]
MTWSLTKNTSGVFVGGIDHGFVEVYILINIDIGCSLLES